MTKRKPTIVTRREAIRRGLSHYFTGKPCKRGHVAERQTSDRECIPCRRLGLAKYRLTPKGKETKRRANTSPKGRETFARYRRTPKANATQWRYDQTPKAIEKRNRYSQSERGQENRRRADQRQKTPRYRERRAAAARERRLNRAIEAARNSTNPDYDQARLAQLLARRLKDGR